MVKRDTDITGTGSAELDALERGVDRGDWDAVVSAARTGWFELVSYYGQATRAQLERVPLAVLRSRPLLAMLLGVTYNNLGLHRIRGLRYLVLAVRAARNPRNHGLVPLDRALIRSAEATALRLIGRPGLSIGPARAALAALDGLADTDRENVGDLPRVYAQLGISLYYAGEVADALDAFATGLAVSPHTPPSSGFGNLSMLAGIHALQGELPEAQTYVEYARTGPWSDRQRRMYTGTFYRLAEAILALERFDADAAQAHLEAMEHDRRTIEHWIAEAHVTALARLVAGRPGEALAGVESYATMRGAEGRTPLARDRLAPIRLLLQLALGNPDAAAVIAERDMTDRPERSIALARVHLSMDRNGSALRELKAAAEGRLTARSRAEASAIEAAVMLRLAPTTRTRGVIDELGALLEETRQRLALVLLPVEDLSRVTAALSDAGYAHVIDDLPLRAFLPDAEPETLLTDREVIVLSKLMETGSVVEIASALVVSGNTVKTQLKSIYRKLGVSNREDAIAVAIARHLLVERD